MKSKMLCLIFSILSISQYGYGAETEVIDNINKYNFGKTVTMSNLVMNGGMDLQGNSISNAGVVYGTATNASTLEGHPWSDVPSTNGLSPALTYIGPSAMWGYNGTAIAGDPYGGGIFWYVVYSDTDASFHASFIVPVSGTYKFRIFFGTDAVNSSKTMNGTITAYKFDNSYAYVSLVSGGAWNLAIPDAQWAAVGYIYSTGYTLNAGDLIQVWFIKNNNAGGATGGVRFQSWALVKQ